MKLKSIFALSLLAACSFLLGLVANTVVYRGQYAMASFMTSHSVLAYLQKGDVTSATLLLRASAEANILEADKYGDWELWIHNPNAMSKWFAEYENLRSKLPEITRGPVDPEFDSRLNQVLKKAAEKVKAEKQSSSE